MSVRILIGDCRDRLKELPDQSVHCCVTSPPYFGLRDYGCEGQMGLEPTPDEFVAGMVEVFREVRRVLRDDGVLFLNIGDTYFGGGRGGGSEGSKQRTNVGALIGPPKWSEVNGGGRRAAACGKTGKALEGSLASDCFCRSLCGACREAYRIGKSHSGQSHAPTPSASSFASILGHTGSPSDRLPTSDSDRPLDRSLDAIPSFVLGAVPEGEQLPDALASTMLQSSPQPLETCSEGEILDGECRLCARSLADCVPAFGGMGECICGSVSLASVDRNQGMDASASAYRGFTTESLKPKDLIGIPWMLAFTLRADGWYLRQDLIWSKPNPMPESVRDRCTKAHEYLFLLSKGPRYYYDAESIAEPLAYEPHAPGNTKLDASRNDHDQMQKVWGANGTRNKRSVWEVATQPFSEAHFATFPPALIEPCILAGCPKGGTVLDPFGGAGTTGLVADRLQRDAILIELNPEYAEIARRRIEGDSPMFAQVAA